MKKRYIFFIGLVLIYGGYKLVYPTYSWNQKLTISVNTPEGIKTGDGIMHVTSVSHPIFLNGRSTGSYQGVASFVALPNNKYLFVFAKNAPRLIVDVFKDKSPNDDIAYDKRYKQFARDLSKSSAKRDVNLDFNGLRAIYFSDISDPNTAYKVDLKDLAATFGEGYSLNALTLELTDEEMTFSSIEKVIPWLNDSISFYGLIKELPWRPLNVEKNDSDKLKNLYFKRNIKLGTH